MLPLREDAAPRTIPVVVCALIAANAAVFLACVAAGPGEVAEWFERFGLVPRVFLAALQGPPQVAWWTPLSAMFLHGGLLHLVGNALYLWVFGRAIEDLLGWQRFALFYVVCGLAASLVHVAVSPTSYLPTIGASGAVSGLLGAYAVSYPAGRLRLSWLPLRVPAIALLFPWLALQLASGVSSWGGIEAGVAWWAHVGGFVAGAWLARSMWIRRPRRSRQRI